MSCPVLMFRWLCALAFRLGFDDCLKVVRSSFTRFRWRLIVFPYPCPTVDGFRALVFLVSHRVLLMFVVSSQFPPARILFLFDDSLGYPTRFLMVLDGLLLVFQREFDDCWWFVSSFLSDVDVFLVPDECWCVCLLSGFRYPTLVIHRRLPPEKQNISWTFRWIFIFASAPPPIIWLRTLDKDISTICVKFS